MTQYKYDLSQPPLTRTVQKELIAGNPESVIDVEETYYEPIAMTEEEVASGQVDTVDLDAWANERERKIRNQLLLETDWVNAPDVTMTDEKRAEWTTYRQALRDMPSHANWPEVLPEDWPTQPT